MATIYYVQQNTKNTFVSRVSLAFFFVAQSRIQQNKIIIRAAYVYIYSTHFFSLVFTINKLQYYN